MRLIVIALLVAIVVSLFSGLVLIYSDRDDTARHRVVRALTLRVALSLLLFLLLMGGYYFGLIGSKLA
jgi:hypothetical protein